MSEVSKTVISKWNKRRDGIAMEMVVHKTPLGKKNGVMKYRSQTFHVPQSKVKPTVNT